MVFSMLSWIKWLIPVLLLMGVLISYGVMNMQTKGNHLSSQEIEIALESALFGELRQGKFDGMSKKEAIGNLISEVTQTQKGIDGAIRVDYVFLDAQNKVTEVEEDISQMQYQIVLLDRNGKEVRAVTSKRVVLDVAD